MNTLPGLLDWPNLWDWPSLWVSFQLLAKECALSTGHLGLSLPRKSVVRLTDRLNMTATLNHNTNKQIFNKQVHLWLQFWDRNSETEKQTVFEPGHEKTCLMSYANNKGADQPAHPRSLINAFVVRCLDSIISLDSIGEISRLASFCGCAGRFVSGLVGNSRRQVFSCRRLIFFSGKHYYTVWHCAFMIEWFDCP